MKKHASKLVALMVAALLLVGSSAQADSIVSKTRSMPQFQRLTQAIKLAGLEREFSKLGWFTMFAPTDAAFERLPDGTWEELIQPERRATLRSILKYHVVRGRMPAAALRRLPSGTNLRTLNSEAVAVRNKNVMGADLAIDAFVSGQSNIRQTGIRAGNGLLHAIDQVLIPPSLAHELARNPQFKSENRTE